MGVESKKNGGQTSGFRVKEVFMFIYFFEKKLLIFRSSEYYLKDALCYCLYYAENRLVKFDLVFKLPRFK